MDIVLNVAFVIAAVQFFKIQFNLSKWAAIGSAFGVSLVVAFLPDLYALFPAAAPILQKIVGLIGMFLAAPGLFDLAVEFQQRAFGLKAKG